MAVTPREAERREREFQRAARTRAELILAHLTKVIIIWSLLTLLVASALGVYGLFDLVF